jgi:hypothetical protein
MDICTILFFASNTVTFRLSNYTSCDISALLVFALLWHLAQKLRQIKLALIFEKSFFDRKSRIFVGLFYVGTQQAAATYDPMATIGDGKN